MTKQTEIDQSNNDSSNQSQKATPTTEGNPGTAPSDFKSEILKSVPFGGLVAGIESYSESRPELK